MYEDIADLRYELVELWIGKRDDSLRLRFEVAWPYYDDVSRSRMEQTKANFIKIQQHPRLAATPEMTSTFCMSFNSRALFFQGFMSGKWIAHIFTSDPFHG